MKGAKCRIRCYATSQTLPVLSRALGPAFLDALTHLTELVATHGIVDACCDVAEHDERGRAGRFRHEGCERERGGRVLSGRFVTSYE